MNLAFGGRVAVIALTILAGIDAADIRVPNIDTSVGDRCAGAMLDDAQREIERCARTAFGYIGADEFWIEVKWAFHGLGHEHTGTRRLGCWGLHVSGRRLGASSSSQRHAGSANDEFAQGVAAAQG
jgi:hypothetical protein